MDTETIFLKAVDILAQLSICLFPVFSGHRPVGSFYDFFNPQVLVKLGIWQTISFLIHLSLMRESWIWVGRRLYHLLYCLLIVACIVSLVLPGKGSGILICLLFAGPVLGVFYFIVCVIEFIRIVQIARRNENA